MKVQAMLLKHTQTPNDTTVRLINTDQTNYPHFNLKSHHHCKKTNDEALM